jgi:hypothetical protein
MKLQIIKTVQWRGAVCISHRWNDDLQYYSFKVRQQKAFFGSDVLSFRAKYADANNTNK